MVYKKITEGIFLERPNRFIARVEINGEEELVHVKNTGRCKELLVDRAKVFLECSDNPDRKTKYDLVAVEKETERGRILVNMDSQAPNPVAEEWLRKGKLFSENAVIKREVMFGNSRFDIYVEDGERRAFIEVKGVTLENDGVASFPDAPTQRGVKHINELCRCIDEGFEAFILFVIQMKAASVFRPNDETHKEFGDALRKAEKLGVNLIAYDCIVEKNLIFLDSPIEINL